MVELCWSHSGSQWLNVLLWLHYYKLLILLTLLFDVFSICSAVKFSFDLTNGNELLPSLSTEPLFPHYSSWKRVRMYTFEHSRTSFFFLHCSHVIAEGFEKTRFYGSTTDLECDLGAA